MFRRYAFCLAPALAAYFVIYLLSSNNRPFGASDDVLIGLVFTLIGIGTIYCATCVARKVFKSIESPGASRWVLSILTFIGVAIGYIAIAFAGCCGVLIAGDGLR